MLKMIQLCDDTTNEPELELDGEEVIHLMGLLFLEALLNPVGQLIVLVGFPIECRAFL